MPRPDGLYSVQWNEDKSIRVQYDKDDARAEDIIPARVFNGIDFDGDPNTWVPMANLALANHDPAIARKAVFIIIENRRIEDHGRGDVREEYDYAGAIRVSGDYPDVRPGS